MRRGRDPPPRRRVRRGRSPALSGGSVRCAGWQARRGWSTGITADTVEPKAVASAPIWVERSSRFAKRTATNISMVADSGSYVSSASRVHRVSETHAPSSNWACTSEGNSPSPTTLAEPPSARLTVSPMFTPRSRAVDGPSTISSSFWGALPDRVTSVHRGTCIRFDDSEHRHAELADLTDIATDRTDGSDAGMMGNGLHQR